MGQVSHDFIDTIDRETGEARPVAKAVLRIEFADGYVHEYEFAGPVAVHADRTRSVDEVYSDGSFGVRAETRHYLDGGAFITATVQLGSGGWQARIAPPER